MNEIVIRISPNPSEYAQERRDRCDELREYVDDVVQLFGPACKGLNEALDAYEREPYLLEEIERLKHELNLLKDS